MIISRSIHIGWRSLVGCSPWGRDESDMTERLHFHFLHSCIGEGNGNPLQCSYLETPRDGGAWWAAVYGVTQSQTRLKRLRSSSRHPCCCKLHYFIFIYGWVIFYCIYVPHLFFFLKILSLYFFFFFLFFFYCSGFCHTLK